jgi:hypothetical protein
MTTEGGLTREHSARLMLHLGRCQLTRQAFLMVLFTT